MAHHPVKKATATSQAVLRVVRHSSSAYHPASQVSVVVTSEKNEGPYQSTIGVNSQKIHASIATAPLATRRASTKSSAPVHAPRTRGMSAGQPASTPGTSSSEWPGKYFDV